MKILLISPLPPPEGGIATWTAQYKQYCQKNNIDVAIVNTAVTGRRLDKINNKISLRDEFGRSYNIFCELKRCLKKYRPDVVHINSSCSRFGLIRDYLCVKICQRKHIPIIFHCRCNVTDRIKNSRFAHILFHASVRCADMVLTLNTPSTQFVKSLVGNKVRIVPNFISSDLLPTVTHIRDIIEQVIFVGHVQFDKGIREIGEVARQLPQVQFWVVGPISAQVDVSLFSPNVQFWGNIEHETVLRMMQKSDVFLFPSYTEGFSNAMVEAMAVGLPIIATDVGANADMLENHGGCIVPVGDSTAIMHGMDTIRESSTREEMSRWNRQKVEVSYRIETVFDTLMTIYKEVMSNQHKEKK